MERDETSCEGCRDSLTAELARGSLGGNRWSIFIRSNGLLEIMLLKDRSEPRLFQELRNGILNLSQSTNSLENFSEIYEH